MFRFHTLGAAALAAALVPSSLLAQDRYYQPAEAALVSVRVSDVPSWKAALDQSRIWQLCLEPEIKAALDLAVGRYEERNAVLVGLFETLAEEGADATDAEMIERLSELEDAQWEDLRLWVYVEDDEPALVFAMRTGEEDGKKITGVIDDIVDRLVEDGQFERSDDGPEIDGQKAMKLVIQQEDPEAEGQRNSAVGVGSDLPPQIWYWQRDGLILIGMGDHAPIGSLTEEPCKRSPIDEQLLGENAGLFFSLDMTRVIALYEEEEGDPDEIEMARKMRVAFGIDGVRSVSWAFGFDGADLRESMFVETEGEVGGLLGSWLDATAPMPAHPQIDDAMMQLGFAVDLQRFQKSLDEFEMAMTREGEEPPEPNEMKKLLPDLAKALTGGMSLQVSGPAVGGMVPRLSMAFGVADREALDALIERARGEFDELTFEERETDGVTWTCVKIPNSPSALIPSYTFLDDVLVLAESPATIRATIRAHADAPKAMPVENAPQATPFGDPAPAFDARYDGSAIWQVMQERYVPMVKLGLSQVMMTGALKFTPLLEAREMPDLEPIGEGLSLGRGGLTRTDNGFVISGAGTFGDPVSTALMAVYTPLMPVVMGLMVDQMVAEAQGSVGRARMQKVWQALAMYRTSFGNGSSLPSELGELFTRGLIENEETLLVPGDEDPSMIEYEDLDGEIQEIESSFRYSPGGKLKVTENDLWMHSSAMGNFMLPFARFSDDEEDDKELAIILYEQRPHDRGERLVMTEDGKIHSLSEEGAKKILGQ